MLHQYTTEIKMSSRNSAKSQVILPELMDDIACRFLLDATSKEMENPIAVGFLTELSHWFYLDEYVEEDDNLDSIKFEPFAIQLLNHVKFKPKDGTSIEDLLVQFKDFKQRVPTYGALILNEDLSHVLLAQGFYHRESWGFPKGKINVDEELHVCAIREVLEETGFDISPYIDANQYIENLIGEQKVRLYIIPGVPMDTQFVPKTKNEIKELRWFPIHQLPAHKNDRTCKKKGSTNMFYMVMPFIKPLREWIAQQTCGRESRRRRRHSSTSGRDSIRHTSSPTTRGDSGPHRHTYTSYTQDDSTSQERQWHHSESSPWKKDVRLKNKQNKKLFMEHKNQNVPGNTQQMPENTVSDEHQKFVFKNRHKTRNMNTNQGVVVMQRQNSNKINENIKTSNGYTFKSYTWQNFRINKKGINEALDRAWSGLSL